MSFVFGAPSDTECWGPRGDGGGTFDGPRFIFGARGTEAAFGGAGGGPPGLLMGGGGGGTGAEGTAFGTGGAITGGGGGGCGDRGGGDGDEDGDGDGDGGGGGGGGEGGDRGRGGGGGGGLEVGFSAGPLVGAPDSSIDELKCPECNLDDGTSAEPTLKGEASPTWIDSDLRDKTPDLFFSLEVAMPEFCEESVNTFTISL